MKLHNLNVLQLAVLAALQPVGRLVRTVQGVIQLRRTWRCAWILAERK